MKAITLWQPWASLWLSPAKVHETRSWPTKHRGYLLVHAAKRECDATLSPELEDICVREFGRRWRRDLPRASLIGRVDLVECLSTNIAHSEHVDDGVCGDFGPDRFMWRRDRFHKFDTPIPYVGRQGMFTIPDEFFLDLLNIKGNES
jgi:hypothetical protein